MDFMISYGSRVDGPFTAEEIEDLHGAGKITKDTPCRRMHEQKWKTVDDLVPTAKWVSAPRTMARPMKSTFPGSTDTYGERCSFAGWICIAIIATCSTLTVATMEPWLMLPAGAAGIAAMLAGVGAIVLGERKQGILILLVSTAILLVMPISFAYRFTSALQDAGEQLRQELPKITP